MNLTYTPKVQNELRELARVVRFCIAQGNATGAYVYARMLARHVDDCRYPHIDTDPRARHAAMTEMLIAMGKTKTDAAMLARDILGM